MTASAIQRRIGFFLLAIVLLEMIIALFQHQWSTAILTFSVIVLVALPLFLAHKLHVYIPAQFQLITIAIVFAAIFLGEVQDYYRKFWWWDSALHAVTGFLMGIIGFLLVHIFNQVESIGLHMKSGFVAIFAFMFALGAGAIWEISEFFLDTLLGTNLQKPMWGDASGLTDTMVDLMLDALGAMVICVYGYWHLKQPSRTSFLMRWIDSFVDNNPRLLRRWRPRQQKD